LVQFRLSIGQQTKVIGPHFLSKTANPLIKFNTLLIKNVERLVAGL